MGAPDPDDDKTILGPARPATDDSACGFDLASFVGDSTDSGRGRAVRDVPTLTSVASGEAAVELSEAAALIVRDDLEFADDSPLSHDDFAGTALDRTLFYKLPADSAVTRQRAVPVIEGYEILGELGRGGMGVRGAWCRRSASCGDRSSRPETSQYLLEQVKTTEPVPPSRLVPGLSRDVETIALKLAAWQSQYPRLMGVFSHAAAVRCVAFSPDGNTVVTASDDGTARLWDAATAQPRGEPLAHQKSITAVAFSPDGKVVVAGSWDKTARLWDAVTGKPIGPPLAHQATVRAVAFSPDGKTVVTGSEDRTARLWSAVTGQAIGPALKHDRGVRTVAFSPDGKFILTASDDNTARLWSGSTGLPIGEPMTHQAGVRSVAFSPDGQTVLTGSADGTARFWSAGTGQPVGLSLPHRGAVWAALLQSQRQDRAHRHRRPGATLGCGHRKGAGVGHETSSLGPGGGRSAPTARPS